MLAPHQPRRHPNTSCRLILTEELHATKANLWYNRWYSWGGGSGGGGAGGGQGLVFVLGLKNMKESLSARSRRHGNADGLVHRAETTNGPRTRAGAVGRSVGRSVGQSVGRSVGRPAAGRSAARPSGKYCARTDNRYVAHDSCSRTQAIRKCVGLVSPEAVSAACASMLWCNAVITPPQEDSLWTVPS